MFKSNISLFRSFIVRLFQSKLTHCQFVKIVNFHLCKISYSKKTHKIRCEKNENIYLAVLQETCIKENWPCLRLIVSWTWPLCAALPIISTTTWWDAPSTEWPSTATISSPEKSRPSMWAAPPETIWPMETCTTF